MLPRTTLCSGGRTLVCSVNVCISSCWNSVRDTVGAHRIFVEWRKIWVTTWRKFVFMEINSQDHRELMSSGIRISRCLVYLENFARFVSTVPVSWQTFGLGPGFSLFNSIVLGLIFLGLMENGNLAEWQVIASFLAPRLLPDLWCNRRTGNQNQKAQKKQMVKADLRKI